MSSERPNSGLWWPWHGEQASTGNGRPSHIMTYVPNTSSQKLLLVNSNLGHNAPTRNIKNQSSAAERKPLAWQCHSQSCSDHVIDSQNCDTNVVWSLDSDGMNYVMNWMSLDPTRCLQFVMQYASENCIQIYQYVENRLFCKEKWMYWGSSCFACKQLIVW